MEVDVARAVAQLEDRLVPVKSKRSLKRFTANLVLPSLIILFLMKHAFRVDGETAREVFDEIHVGMTAREVERVFEVAHIKNNTGLIAFFRPEEGSKHYGFQVLRRNELFPPSSVWVTIDNDEKVCYKELIGPSIGEIGVFWIERIKKL